MVTSPSIKRRLLGLVLGAVALVWLGTAVVVYFDARDEIDDVLDGHLAQAAALIMAQSGGAAARRGADVPTLHKDSRRVAFQVWQRGRLLLHSENAPDAPLARKDDGYSDTEVGGERWRVFSSRDAAAGVTVHVAERDKTRRELARDVALNVLYPLLYALPLLALVMWLAIAHGMRPLHAVARAVGAREPDNLAPVEAGAAPAEVAPLVTALNRLFARISASIAGEKRFTADAAHELRTPIAAIRAQAQVARRAAGDDERTRALDNVVAGCDRAAHLVDQLLVLARLDRAGAGAHGTCSLRAVAAEALSDVAPAAAARDIQLALEGEGDVEIRGEAALLRVMLRNLVDNAVRYSPPGTSVRVLLARDGGAGRVTVADEGPGIAVEDRERAFERFYRGLGTGAEGTGLGLSIARRIADLHGATLTLDTAASGRGLAATATFPLRRNGGARP